MKILENQILYQCEYCDKRLLSKNGAKLHEKQYCRSSPIVKQKRLDEIAACDHKMDTSYSLITGESYAREPDYDYCVKCNANK